MSQLRSRIVAGLFHRARHRLAPALCALAAAAVPAVAADPLESRVAALLEQMTLAEKVGQMIQAEIRHITPDEVGEFCIGSVLNGGGAFPGNDKAAAVADWLALADAYQRAAASCRLQIPLLWGTDAVHGHNNVMGATLFPHNIGLGATGEPALVARIGEATAREIAATGIDWTFAPTVAVVRDMRWGRSYEGYAAAPGAVADFGAALVNGLQGRAGGDWFGPGRVIATAKHFIGDGATQRGIDQGDAQLDEQTLLSVHGAGYHSTIAAGVQTVMASFNSWQGDKVHGNHHLLTEVLKERWGFEGFVVSDWNGVGQVHGCNNESCPQAINAGIDMLMVPEDWRALMANTIRQVEEGEIPRSRIDDAVRRILRVKLRAGLFEHPLPSQRDYAGDAAWVGHPSHRTLAREAVRKSVVMLKNTGALVPLAVRGRHVLVAGSAADDIGRQSGGWTLSWQGTGNDNRDFPGATSIYGGIRAAVEAAGGSAELAVDGQWQARPDLAVVVFGEQPYAEGQGDLETLNLVVPGEDPQALMRSLSEQQIPVVAVLVSGRTLWVNPELNAADAFVVAWLPGSEGQGVADVLVADAAGEPRYPLTGRLPFPWPGQDVNPADPSQAVAEFLFPAGFGLAAGQASDPGLRFSEVALGAGEVTERVIFDGRTHQPWHFFIGDSSDWQRRVEGSRSDSPFGALTVSSIDRRVQEDARRLVWRGDRLSQAYWHADDAMDVSALAGAGGVLGMSLRPEGQPRGPLYLRMDCSYPCGGAIDLAPVLRELPQGEWHDIAVELSCLARAGADLRRVDAPAVFASEAAAAFSLSDLRITTRRDGYRVLPCEPVQEPTPPQ